MSAVRGLLAVFAVVGLAVAAPALASHLDPQKKIRPADQARARAMLVKKADLGLGFNAQRSGSGDIHMDCKAADESDLTLTGEVESPLYAGVGGLVFVSSAASVYESVADANTSWRRGTSAAGTKCASETLRREFAKQRIRLASFRPIAFPRVSQRTVAYRAKLSGESAAGPVTVFVDVVVLMRSRAQVGIFFGSALVVPNREDELRLARVVARRMAKTMS